MPGMEIPKFRKIRNSETQKIQNLGDLNLETQNPESRELKSLIPESYKNPKDQKTVET